MDMHLFMLTEHLTPELASASRTARIFKVKESTSTALNVSIWYNWQLIFIKLIEGTKHCISGNKYFSLM